MQQPQVQFHVTGEGSLFASEAAYSVGTQEHTMSINRVWAVARTVHKGTTTSTSMKIVKCTIRLYGYYRYK